MGNIRDNKSSMDNNRRNKTMIKYIIRNGNKMYLYGVYNSKRQALKTSLYYKRKKRAKGIIIYKKGKYRLYLNKVIKLW